MLAVAYLIADEVYISDGEDPDARDDFYWHDKPAPIEVSHQDGQVRIGVVTEPGRSEDVGLYFSPARARDLIVALAAAVAVAEEG